MTALFINVFQIDAGDMIIFADLMHRIVDHRFQAVIEERIETLSDRVERHNSVIERTFHLEERASVLEEKVRVANHRIEDLEKHD